MNIKELKKKYAENYLKSHLLLIAFVTLLLCLGIGFGLDIYTHHGENILVPNLIGKSYEQAYKEMEEQGLIVQVSDSGYNKQQPANTILAQTPNAGMHVKQGHVIYVTVNSPSSPTFAIPDIIDNSSLREAEARLSAMGFHLTEPQEVEGEKDWVYGIVCQGRRVSNGDRVSIERPLTLLVGRGVADSLDELGILEDSLATMNGDSDSFVEVGPTE